jgi:hypothetical protein
MNPTPPAINAFRATQILHGALVLGLALAGGVFFMLLRVRGQPLEGGPNLGPVLAGAAAGLLLLAALFLRRRVPPRRYDQTPEAYWTSVEIRGASILLWAVVDGAGLLGWVGYVLTGASVPAAAAVLALVVLLLFRPSRLEGEGAA